MLMKIPKETNFSNKRSSKYLNDWTEEPKSDYTYSTTKYSTATPVRGKYIKQLEEYTWEPEETIRMFDKSGDSLHNINSQSRTIRAHQRSKRGIEEFKEMAHTGIKLLHLKKVPPIQLDLNPSVDSTPREISVTSLASSISSIFLSPAKLEKVCQNKFGKIKDKVLKSNSEFSQDFNMTSIDYSGIYSGKNTHYKFNPYDNKYCSHLTYFPLKILILWV